MSTTSAPATPAAVVVTLPEPELWQERHIGEDHYAPTEALYTTAQIKSALAAAGVQVEIKESGK